SVEVRRKVWNQIVVWFEGSVVDVAGGSDKQKAGSICLVDGVEELLTEERAAKARIQDADVCAFRPARRYPKIPHGPGVLDCVNRIQGVSETVLIEKLQRH